MTPIEQIKAAIRVDEYAARYLTVRNGKALCPFHKEKSPSLALHEDYAKCFGCGWSGDVIKFAAAFHDVSTGDAIRMLAEEAGVTLTRQPEKHPYDVKKAERTSAEAAEWRSQIRRSLVEARNRSFQLQAPWKCEYYERSTQQPGMLPDIGCRWTQPDIEFQEPDDASDRIEHFLALLDGMPKREILSRYLEQKTLDQASMLRESLREAALWEKAMTPLAVKLIDRLAGAPDSEFPEWQYGEREW